MKKISLLKKDIKISKTSQILFLQATAEFQGLKC